MSKPPIHLESRDGEGARLTSPSAGRNRQFIAEILKEHLTENASVLEIASGTGEHGLAICEQRPDVSWQYSDPDQQSRDSQDQWRLERPGQLSPALELNTMHPEWWGGLPTYDAFFCANMIHISPWAAAEGLAKGAGHLLSPKGDVFLYGPFKEGDATAPSNLDFDESLKRRNPEWGVRELESVKHIFADAGFNLGARIVMPKENRILKFSRLP